MENEYYKIQEAVYKIEQEVSRLNPDISDQEEKILLLEKIQRHLENASNEMRKLYNNL